LIGDSNEQKINYSQDLFFEFDGFLVQLKSTLDYLVKIPSFILENRIWTLRTFGNKGEDVVSFLSNNMPKQYRGMATLIIEHIIKHHLGWLKHTIAARDKINHFIDEGVSYEHFYVQKINQEGIDKIHVPLWTESMTVQEFMHNIWMDLFSLSEQFVAAFLAIRVKPGSNLVHYKSVAYSTDSPLIVLNNEQLEEKRKEIDAMGGIILSDLNQVVEKKAEERRQRGEQNKKEVEIRRVQQPKRGKVNRGS